MSEQKAKTKKIERRRTDNFICWFFIGPLTFLLSSCLAFGLVMLLMAAVKHKPPGGEQIFTFVCSVGFGLFIAFNSCSFYRKEMEDIEKNTYV